MTAATLLRRSVRALVFCAGILFCAFFLCRSAQAGRTVLPGRLKTVEEEAFAGDRRLNVAVVGEGVTAIGARAFAGSALKGCMIASGEAEIYYRGGLTSEWDTAAMQCIVEEAGGILRQMDDSEMVYNRENTLNEKGFYILNREENRLDLK